MAILTLERGLEVLEGRCRIASYVIFAYIALSALMTLVVFGLVGGWINSDESAELSTLSAIGSLVSVAYIAIFFICIVPVSMWIYRGHANLRDAGVEGLEFTPGWSIGWFFVPIANLFKPFQAMRELWTVSHAQADSYAKDAPPELITWWACYIIGSALKNVSVRLNLEDESGYILDGLGTVVLIASAWCLLRIVRSITRAQGELLSMTQTFA